MFVVTDLSRQYLGFSPLVDEQWCGSINVNMSGFAVYGTMPTRIHTKCPHGSLLKKKRERLKQRVSVQALWTTYLYGA